MYQFIFDLQRFVGADTTVPANLKQKAWSRDLWMAALNEIYFDKFMGESQGNIIQKLTNLKKEAGDSITIPLMMKLSGAGVTDDADLEGEEEALQFYDFAVTVHEYAHAVRLKGNLEEQKTALNLRKAAKDGLKMWLAEKIDGLIFTALTASPTSTRLLYGGDAAAENEIVDADVLTLGLISKAKRIAQLANPKIRPVKVKGQDYWVCLMHPYQARDLKAADTAKWETIQKEANIRGESNPIFSGALGVYDGVVLHEHPTVSVTATGASSANAGHALFMGAQAGAIAVAQESAWREKMFNYGKRAGFATDTILGVAKSVFNSVDFATVQIRTGAKAD